MQLKFTDDIGYDIYLRMPLFLILFFLITIGNLQFEMKEEVSGTNLECSASCHWITVD